MLQTAQLDIPEQYLNIVAKDESIVQPSEEVVSYNSIRNALFVKVASFYYKERVRLSFSVSEMYRSQYVMIKGLIEFHRKKDFVFYYNLKQGTLEIDIQVDQLEDLQLFLSSVLQWLKAENQFRLALKIALEFEKRYKLERDSIYDLMKRTTGASCIN